MADRSTLSIRRSWPGSHSTGQRTMLETQAYGDAGERWREIADQIHAEVCDRGFDRDLNTFVQAYDSKQVDASLLLIPLVGFLPADDPRVRGTLRAVEERLLIDNEFVLRYQSHDAVDGLPAGEGAFLVCSFWLVDNYILQGRHEEARRLFDRLLSRRNDVGLLSEEFDLQTGRMLGNFPQAYSHVGLINCALNLSRQVGPTKERAEVNRREINDRDFLLARRPYRKSNSDILVMQSSQEWLGNDAVNGLDRPRNRCILLSDKCVRASL